MGHNKEFEILTWPQKVPDPTLIELHGKCSFTDAIGGCCWHKGVKIV